VLLILGLLAGAASVALGVALVAGVDSAFGAVWALGFVVLGVIVLLSAVALQPRWAGALPPARQETWHGESAVFHPRRSGVPGATTFLTTGLLGAWFVAIGVVGAVEETWVWLLLAAVPAAYFSGFAILWVLGRFRPGGVWVTRTRVVDEHYGLRSEVALADVVALSPRSQTLHLTLREGAAVTRRRLTPKPWRARSTALEIRTKDLRDGSHGLAQELQPRTDTRGR
jgi:hypothetical protein